MKKIAAVDFGLKRIGIALSDPSKTIAFPFKTVEGGVNAVLEALKGQSVELILVGLPLLMNGQKGDMAEKAEKFAGELEILSGIKVLLIDERLSSRGADQQMRQQTHLSRKDRDAKIDRVSAALMLQTYLDSLK